jgi:hypothetical protein
MFVLMLLVTQVDDKAVGLVKVEPELSVVKNNVRIRILDFDLSAPKHTRIEISGQYCDWSNQATKRMGFIWIPLQKNHLQTNSAPSWGCIAQATKILLTPNCQIQTLGIFPFLLIAYVYRISRRKA